MTAKKRKDEKFEYEFNGPVGAFGILVLLPLVVLLLAHWTETGNVDLTFLRKFSNEPFWVAVTESPILCPSCSDPTVLLKCAAGVLAWFAFHVLLERVLPGPVVLGTLVKQDPKGVRLPYRINGHLGFWVTMMVVAVGFPFFDAGHKVWQFGAAPLELLYTHFAELAFVTIALCFVLSTYLYLISFMPNKVLAAGGVSGNAIYDYFIGRELNPRIGSFDWKVFCELRPGLVGWMLINAGCMIQQQKELGYVTGSMMLVNIFQGIYVWDAQFQEQSILTTMDITTDGFGFMLAFGDLAWVPFTYSVQAKYLVRHDPKFGLVELSLILGLHMLGYLVFRGANGQKDAFRRDPDAPHVAHLKFLQTKRGTKLLTSGWWGMARKINYTGDWIMGLSWCLVCGFNSIVPYYYAIYFAILLIHRSIRDDHMCQEKYGEDWQTYKKLVPYRFIPGIV